MQQAKDTLTPFPSTVSNDGAEFSVSFLEKGEISPPFLVLQENKFLVEFGIVTSPSYSQHSYSVGGYRTIHSETTIFLL